MSPWVAVLIGVLYSAAFYLLLRRNLAKLIIGLALLSHAANLLILVAGGLSRGAPPIIEKAAQQPTEPFADPLPQALILTAIVISFGLLAFTLVLLYRARQELDIDDLDRIP